MMAQDAGGADLATPHWRDLRAHVWWHRRLIWRGMAAGLLLTAALAALLPQRFTAHAVLAVLPAPEFSVRPDAGERAGYAGVLAMDQIMKAESEILVSQSLAAQLVQRFGAAAFGQDGGGPAAWLRRVLGAADSQAARDARAMRALAARLSVLPSRNANIIALDFADPDPQLAAAVLQALISAYAQQRELLYRDPQLPALGREVAAAEDEFAANARALDAFKARRVIANFTLERDLLLQRRDALDAQLAAAQGDVAGAQAGMRAAQAAIQATPKLAAAFSEYDPAAQARPLDDALARAERDLDDALPRYRPDSLRLQGLRAARAAAFAARREVAEDRGHPLARQERSPLLDQAQQAALQATLAQAQAAARLAVLTAQAQGLAARLRALLQDEAALHVLEQREQDSARRLDDARAAAAARRISEAAAAARLARVAVVQPPLVPVLPSGMRLQILLLGSVLAILLPPVWLVGGFARRARFYHADSLRAEFGVPVLLAVSARAPVTASGRTMR